MSSVDIFVLNTNQTGITLSSSDRRQESNTWPRAHRAKTHAVRYTRSDGRARNASYHIKLRGTVNETWNTTETVDYCGIL